MPRRFFIGDSHGEVARKAARLQSIQRVVHVDAHPDLGLNPRKFDD
jgi:hypothetical protein